MLVSFDFKMKQLNRTRTITVRLPDDYYQSNKRYPVIYIQDGQNAYFDHLSFCGDSWGFMLENRDVIMVAIPCNFDGFKRMDEYGPWKISKKLSYQETKQRGMIIGGEGKAYVKWMIDELKPYIDRRFTTDPNDTAIIGSSMGGVISAYAGLKYPHIFNKVAALSTAYWFYMKEFKKLIHKTTYPDDFYFYFDLGEFEGCGDEEIDQWYIETNDEVYDWLKDKIKHLDYHYFEGVTHNESEWRKRVPYIMELFYGGNNNV